MRLHRWIERPALRSALQAGADPALLAGVFLKLYQPIRSGKLEPRGLSAFVRGRLEALAGLARPLGTDLSELAASVEVTRPAVVLPLRFRVFTVFFLVTISLLYLLVHL